MLKKIINICLVLLIVAFCINNVAASNPNILDNIFEQGNKLNGEDGFENKLGKEIVAAIKGTIVPIIELIGNLIFAAVTVILGVKYIWSSAEGKSEVQESLPAFICGVIFFYLAGTLVNFITGVASGMSNAGSWNDYAGNILWMINSVVRYAALAGIVFIGLKYMFASAEGRASMKNSMGTMVLGIIFVFLSTNIIDFIVAASREIL